MTDGEFNNSGSLFKNDRKTKESQPGYRGDLNVICPHCEARSEFWLSAWVRKATGRMKSGDKWISIAIDHKEKDKYKERYGHEDGPDKSKEEGFDADDDEIPF